MMVESGQVEKSGNPKQGGGVRQPEISALERRVLAHERILQALITHLAEMEPQILRRLSDQFSDPIGRGRSEQDYVDTSAYAAAFIRAVICLGEPPRRPLSARLRQPGPVATEIPAGTDDLKTPESESGSIGPGPRSAVFPEVTIRNRSGVWEVRVNGCFSGDYTSEEVARDVAKAIICAARTDSDKAIDAEAAVIAARLAGK